MRLQLALNVRDLDEAVAYYGELFNAEPHKRHPGYANFAIDQPPLKLVLFEDPEAAERLNHLGVEAFAEAEVADAEQRLRNAGILTQVQRTKPVATRRKTKSGRAIRKACVGSGIALSMTSRWSVPAPPAILAKKIAAVHEHPIAAVR